MAAKGKSSFAVIDTTSCRYGKPKVPLSLIIGSVTLDGSHGLNRCLAGVHGDMWVVLHRGVTSTFGDMALPDVYQVP